MKTATDKPRRIAHCPEDTPEMLALTVWDGPKYLVTGDFVVLQAGNAGLKAQTDDNDVIAELKTIRNHRQKLHVYWIHFSCDGTWLQWFPRKRESNRANCEEVSYK